MGELNSFGRILAGNSFGDDIEFSLSMDELWESFYQWYFAPAVVLELIATDDDKEMQEQGIDRIVITDNRAYTIDEKLRRKTYYTDGEPDVLLEYIANDQKQSAGWIEEGGKTIDYLAYCFADTRVVHMFDFATLQACWFRNKENWLNQYRIIKASAGNTWYKSWSVAVPLSELLRAYNDSMSYRVPSSVPATSPVIKFPPTVPPYKSQQSEPSKSKIVKLPFPFLTHQHQNTKKG